MHTLKLMIFHDTTRNNGSWTLMLVRVNLNCSLRKQSNLSLPLSLWSYSEVGYARETARVFGITCGQASELRAQVYDNSSPVRDDYGVVLRCSNLNGASIAEASQRPMPHDGINTTAVAARDKKKHVTSACAGCTSNVANSIWKHCGAISSRSFGRSQLLSASHIQCVLGSLSGI